MAELPQLPADVLPDILCWLPVKPLQRFKCVSKAWCSMISDPQFAKNHLNSCKNNRNGDHQRLFLMTDPFHSVDFEAYKDGDENLPITQLVFPIREPVESDDQIIGSCDGLLCAVFDEDYHHIIVWNPSTGQSRELPKLDSRPKVGKSFYGFGYDGNLDDYKVVVGYRTTSQNSSSLGYKVKVFTLKSGKWRTIEFLQCCYRVAAAGTLANGVLHWQALKINLQNLKRVIVPFDLEAEKFLDEIPLPDVIEHNGLSFEMRVYKDCLCAYTSFLGSHVSSYKAWILKENGGTSGAKWTSLTKFDSHKVRGGMCSLQHLWVAMDGKVVMDLDGKEMVLYNPRDQTVKRFFIQQNWRCFQSIMYIESLVSPIVVDGH